MSDGMNILNYILTMIPYIFFPPLIVFFTSEVLRHEIRHRKAVYISSFVVGIFVSVIHTFVLVNFSNSKITSSLTVRKFGDLIIVIIISIFMTGKGWKRFLTAFLGRDILVYVLTILSAIGYLITGADVSLDNAQKPLSIAALGVLWITIEYLMFFFIAKMRRKKDNTPVPLIVTFTLFTIVTLLANLLPIYWDVPNGLTENRALYLTFILLSLGFVVVLFYITSSRKERKDLMELNQVKEDLIQAETRYFEAAAGMDSKIRALKHDMKNNVSVLSLLLKNGEYDKMKDYLEEMGAAIETADVSAHTGNTIADVIISEKREKAKEAGAVLKVSGSISDIEFSPVDTCKILANILDNAIEAVSDEKLTDLDESLKVINLDFRHTNNFLMMSLRNPCANKPAIKNDTLVTTKRDTKNHGFGLKNVREAAAVYSGELSFECKEKPYGYEFATELLFPINA